MAETERWYYLDAGGSTVGPVDPYQLAGLLDTAVITPESLVWADGQDEWQSLQSQTQLYSQVYHISSSGHSAVPATASFQSDLDAPQAGLNPQNGSEATDSGPANGGQNHAKPSAHSSDGPPEQKDSEIAEFNQIMMAMGESVNIDASETVLETSVHHERSPSPEEKQFVDDDGTMYVWNAELQKFQPQVDPTSALQAEYGEEAMTYQADDEEQPRLENFVAVHEQEEQNSDADEVTPEEALAKEKPSNKQPESPEKPSSDTEHKSGTQQKRKLESVMERQANRLQRAKEQEEASKRWFDLKVNTSVYITGLPEDVTEQKLADRFSHYGVVKPGEGGAPKVKIYRDKETQIPKGDGLVTFLYEPSVQLACNLADDDYFSPDTARKMTVKPAEFRMHGEEYVPKKRGKKNKNSKEKAKVAEKVLGWSGYDDSLKPSQVTAIIENMFHPDEVLEDPSLLKDLENDIRGECSKMGKLEKVRVFAGNPNGVVSVRFKTLEAVDTCINTMKGRFFGGRKLEAHLWDGHTNYNIKLQESEEQINARRLKFAQEIEAQDVQLPEVEEPIRPA